jgi:CheY-like chemotaxis protein
MNTANRLEPSPSGTRKPPPRLLVVEDDSDTREALEELLQSAGYDVLTAPNGAVALNLLRAERERGGVPCSAVVLDLMMPIMNGWDFRARQRADPALAEIPVLLMSAGGHLAAVSDELSAAGHVTKPVDVSDLLAKVARLLG